MRPLNREPTPVRNGALKRAMTRVRQFSIVSLRDLLVASGPTLLAVIAVVVLAYVWVDPAPPRQFSMATGQFNSAYQEFGRQYAARLARDDIKLTLQPSLGSHENLQRLMDGKVDVAFVQSGSTENGQAEPRLDTTGLVSLGSLFTEPVWLFLREGARVAHLTDLKGKRINLGPEGTGVPRLFRQVLDANGIEPNELQIGALENTPATVELLAGRIDGLVFSSAPEAPLIQMLLQTPGIRLFNFTQADAYTRRLPFLTHVVLPRGIVDLGRDIPSQDYHLIAPHRHPGGQGRPASGPGGPPGEIGRRDSRQGGLVPAAGPVPFAEVHRDSGGARGGTLLPRRAAFPAALPALLARQPVRAPVGVRGGAGGAPDPAVEDRPADLRVARALARVPLVRRAAQGGAGARSDRS
ncbi:hypothetical protein MasN3_13740 [Massilia varians]|uniref:TRAP transporter solute receptor, TAXI family n=1 Tax=Massilia varians TaxID=457921 RepID=A0ABN6T6J3_9BURK|nr:hypothetical protein MasN3_13740 [Massilia varians]